jgi:hypothetical protein
MKKITYLLILSSALLSSCGTNEPKQVDQSQVLNQIEDGHILCSGLTDFVSLRTSYGVDSQDSYYDKLVKDSNEASKKVPRYREKNIPDLNKIVTVNIGDEMVIQRTETELLTLESSHPEKMPFLHGRIPLPKQFSPVSLGVSFNADGLIKEVFDNTIADLLGLKQGDEILSLQGKKFESIVSVREVLLDSEKDNIVVTARRNGGVIYLNGKNENVLLPSNNRAELVNVELNENCLIPHDSQLEKTVVFRDYFARNHLSKTLSSRPISCIDDYCSQNSLSIAEGVWDLVSEGQYGNFYFLPKESSVNIDQSMGWSERKTYKLHPKWHIYMPNGNATHTELATVQLADERSSTPIILTIPKSGLPATTPAVQSFTTPNATQQTLYYNGLSGNTLRFTYREFKEDMARDAFTQDVTYDLKLGEVIGFKSSRFKIIEADNLTVTYQVLTHF